MTNKYEKIYITPFQSPYGSSYDYYITIDINNDNESLKVWYSNNKKFKTMCSFVGCTRTLIESNKCKNISNAIKRSILIYIQHKRKQNK